MRFGGFNNAQARARILYTLTSATRTQSLKKGLLMQLIKLGGLKLALACYLVVSVFVPVAHAETKQNRQIPLYLDLSRLVGPTIGHQSQVVIGRVTDARSLTPVGNSSESSPNLLVGQFQSDRLNRVYDVVLSNGKSVEDIVKEVVVISLSRIGYVVLDKQIDDDGDLPVINFEINDFWIEAEPIPDSSRRRFDCNIAISVSGTSMFEEMGKVSVNGFRNGRRPKEAISYSNTFAYTINIFARNFESSFNSAAILHLRKKSLAGNDARGATLEEEKVLAAKKLRDDGLISQQEYERIVESVISE
jgi:hypothetical protein